MTQDTVKDALLALKPTDHPFTVIFSGKKSKVVNGLYRPATREIIIHNRNFETENDLLFTALHEYAHHLDCTEGTGNVSSRAHTIRFWATFHELLSLAESTGLYNNPARGPAFADTTKALRDLITESGRIMREIGQLLIEAQRLCQEEGSRFDDYVMRVLKQTMPWAKAAMAACALRLEEGLGAEGMKIVAAIKNENERARVSAALVGDESPQQVKASITTDREPVDILERLEKEKERIAKAVSVLLGKEAKLERQIEELRGKT